MSEEQRLLSPFTETVYNLWSWSERQAALAHPVCWAALHSPATRGGRLSPRSCCCTLRTREASVCEPVLNLGVLQGDLRPDTLGSICGVALSTSFVCSSSWEWEMERGREWSKDHTCQPPPAGALACLLLLTWIYFLVHSVFLLVAPLLECFSQASWLQSHFDNCFVACLKE